MLPLWIIAVGCAGGGFIAGLLTRRAAPRAAPYPKISEESLGKLADILPVLQEYGISKAENASRREFGKLLLANACRLISADYGTLLAFTETMASLETIASTPQNPGSEFNIEPPKKMAERAFNLQEPVIAAGEPGKTWVSMPLMAQSKPVGVLQLQIKSPLDPTDRRSLALLAGEGAVILHEIHLFERLQAFHMEMVETLYRTVNALDPNSSNHAEQTRSRARRLATALKLPEETVRHVEYAALLRGVGKIGVDQTILNKPGKLTPKEYEEIKKHTTIGHRILKEAKLLAPAAKMVLYHQEWFNGRGYPEGLQGEFIPLGARIIAVIAAWEAMTTDRPYRKALTSDEALAELSRAAGTQFDPAIVEAFRRTESQNAKP